MTGSGKDSDTTVINCGACRIFIYPDTIGTGTISVCTTDGKTLW